MRVCTDTCAFLCCHCTLLSIVLLSALKTAPRRDADQKEYPSTTGAIAIKTPPCLKMYSFASAVPKTLGSLKYWPFRNLSPCLPTSNDMASPSSLFMESAYISPCQQSRWLGSVQLELLRRVEFLLELTASKNKQPKRQKSATGGPKFFYTSFSNGIRIRCIVCFVPPFWEDNWGFFKVRQTMGNNFSFQSHLCTFKREKLPSRHYAATRYHDLRLQNVTGHRIHHMNYFYTQNCMNGKCWDLMGQSSEMQLLPRNKMTAMILPMLVVQTGLRWLDKLYLQKLPWRIRIQSDAHLPHPKGTGSNPGIILRTY